jgi:hypothetical protein
MQGAGRTVCLAVSAATLVLASGCEVVAIASAIADDGYPPPPVYLPQCPYNLSLDSPASDAGGVYQQVYLYPQGLAVNPLIAADEDLSLLFTSQVGEPHDAVVAASATGSMSVFKSWGCVTTDSYQRAAVVELDTSAIGASSVDVSMGATSFGAFDLEVAEPKKLILSYEVGSRFRATLLDDQNRELFADASVEWEATPSGFLTGTDARGMYAPFLDGASAPEITLFAYRGPLMASMRLKNSGGIYVPAD